MNTEDRLRTALHQEASRIEPHDGWPAIEARLDETAPRSRARYALAAAAAVVLVAAAAIVLRSDDQPKPVLTNPGETTTTTPAAVPSTTRYLWPLDDNTSRVFMAPDALVASFAGTFLGIPDPHVGNDRPGEDGTVEVDVYTPGVGASPAVIITTVRAMHDDNGWHVVETTNDTLVLTSPRLGDVVSSPIALRGSSVAFEGTVHFTLLGYGGDFACDQCGGTPQHPFLATTTYTGGGTEMTPFDTTLTYGPTPAQYAIVMMWTDSARDGSLAAATIRWVELAPPQNP